MTCLARVMAAAAANLRLVLVLPLMLVVALGAVSPPAQAATCSIRKLAQTIEVVEAERKELIKQIHALQTEVLRLEAALHDKMEEDEGIIQEVRGLFGDRPSYAEVEQLKQVQARMAELVAYYPALTEEIGRLTEEILFCEKLIQKAKEKARLQALENLTSARPGKNTTRKVPTFDLRSMASSSDEDDTSVSFGPGIGLGDGGTP